MLIPGTRLGPYEVQAAIGAGGMGEVYRARDTKLHRDIALKILPESFASDADRLARFQREAQVLASLNHPNIGGIYGLEEADGIRGLVLELVEGPTLADRLGHGPIPVDEALPIARQIAEALEAAHEQGIIHRDLKPANIKVRPDGTVKVLDFGLAKALEATPGSSPSVSMSPTITTPAMTQVGMVLGTAAYMAPEQARGKVVDKRADIWAFGCVLYETLTGRRAFAGEEVSDTLASVLARDPDWALLPPNLSPALSTYLRRCLHKDPRQRVHDIADVRLALEGAFETAVPQPAPPVRVPQWRRVGLMGASVLIMGVILAGGAVWFVMRPPAPRVMRTTITSTALAALSINGIDRDLAITSDGSRIVYVGTNGTQLFVRALDALEPVAIFKGAPRGPFVSPDGLWVGFADGFTALKKVAMTGGPAITLASLDAAPRGATWAPDATTIFATDNRTTGLQRVPAAGGLPEVLTRPDRAQGEADHLWPEMLPGGRAVLFTTTALTGGLDAAHVTVLDLQTGTRTVLVRGGSHAQYVRSGHLVYAAAGSVWAIAFDLARVETRGTPVPIIGQVVTTATGGVNAVVAGDGTLAYVSGAGGVGAARTLVWVSRQGQETSIVAPPRAYVYPRIAPDGASVTLFSNDQERDLWSWDFSRTTLTRLTFGGALDGHPAWTPDGRRLAFSSERAGARNLYWQAADGRGAVEKLTDSPNVQSAGAVSPDGTLLTFTETAAKTGEDVMQVELHGTHRVTPLVQTPFTERNGILSPDGRWLAYEANDSGQFEVYVRPFPDVNGGHWQVSTGGGTRPLWARNGQELFYLSPAGALMRLGVERGPSWAATTPTLLIKDGYFTVANGFPSRSYDISPDGQRFLLIKAGGGSEQAAAPISLIVVQHFDEELKRLVPTKP
jgi:Tol biopolymer transport system component